MTNGSVRFQLHPGPSLYVESVECEWAGGKIGAEGVWLDPELEKLSLVLKANGIDLGALLALADTEGLSGAGRLSGEIPNEISTDGVVIAGGYLAASSAGGNLRYRPETPHSAFAPGSEEAKILSLVLEDFRYDSLRLDVNLLAAETASVRAHLLGNNPELFNGRQIEFNVNLTGELYSLLEAGFKGYRVWNELLDGR